METKFTPGQWKVTGPSVYVKGRGYIAKALEIYMDKRERLANAQLIAAAPDMYAALEELLYARTDKSEAMALAALAKARGEA